MDTASFLEVLPGRSSNPTLSIVQGWEKWGTQEKEEETEEVQEKTKLTEASCLEKAPLLLNNGFC